MIMDATIKKIQKIGNSQGVILPALLRESAGVTDKVRMHVEGNKIILTAITEEPRAGWSAQFKAAASLDDHELLIPDVLEDEFNEDWTW